jgi:hypothetical protein
MGILVNFTIQLILRRFRFLMPIANRRPAQNDVQPTFYSISRLA